MPNIFGILYLNNIFMDFLLLSRYKILIIELSNHKGDYYYEKEKMEKFPADAHDGTPYRKHLPGKRIRSIEEADAWKGHADQDFRPGV